VLGLIVLGLTLPKRALSGATGQKTYLPIVIAPPQVQLHGYVTENGTSVEGVRVDLLKCQRGGSGTCSSADDIYRSVTTDENGLYNFTNVPTVLAPDVTNRYPDEYRVVFLNHDSDPKRLRFWQTPILSPYYQWTTVNAGNFDIADVVRLAPEDGAQFPLPIDAFTTTLHFTWTPRPASLMDSYRVMIEDGSGGYYSGGIGYSDSWIHTFNVCRGPCSISNNQLYLNGTYAWRIAVSNNDENTRGYGESFSRTFAVPYQGGK
jgi:hypothetical protein